MKDGEFTNIVPVPLTSTLVMKIEELSLDQDLVQNLEPEL
jgi:hypothetical protein